jgi:hypothetical protein
MAQSHRLVQDVWWVVRAFAFPFGTPDVLGVGKIVYVHVFGQGLVFLNTAEACTDLLDKRGAIYSDKPHLVMCGEL